MFYQRINATSCLMLCLMLCTACVPHQPYAAHRLAQLPQQFWVKHPNWSAQGTVLVKQLNHKESVYFNWEHQAQQDRQPCWSIATKEQCLKYSKTEAQDHGRKDSEWHHPS